MIRKRFEWKLKQRTMLLGERTMVMGILNVTPNSFTDGGRYAEPESAYARALALEEAGADVLDVGAESTKPGSARVSEAEELRRLIPVLKRLEGKLSIPISVDTYKAAVAEKAFEHGAEIINDPSGLTFDPDLAQTVSRHDGGLILNHMRGTPETWAKLGSLQFPMGAVLVELGAAANRAVLAGVARQRIVLDPGLGFGKRKEQNLELLAMLPKLTSLEYPVLVGPSRKAFLATEEPEGILFATAAAVTAAIMNGAHMVRVHDVPEMRRAVNVADAILLAEPPPVDTSDSSASRAAPPKSGGSRFRR